MQVFYIIDNVEDLDINIEKINHIFDSKINFFVDSKLYLSISTNKFVMENLSGLYQNSVNKKIDEFIKKDSFVVDDVLLFYNSVKINDNLLLEVKDKIKYGYDAICLRKKEKGFKNFLNKIYSKVVSWMFNVCDALCFTKCQYISKAFLEHLKESKFNNHILKPDNIKEFEIEDGKEIASLKTKIKVQPYSLYNAIAFFVTIILFVLFIVFIKMMFLIYFMFLLLILLEIALAIMLVVNNIFYNRFNH